MGYDALASSYSIDIKLKSWIQYSTTTLPISKYLGIIDCGIQFNFTDVIQLQSRPSSTPKW